MPGLLEVLDIQETFSKDFFRYESINIKIYSHLHFACAKGQVNTVKFLIENGAEINSRDKMGLTPLYLALRKSQTELAIFLLQNGAEVNAFHERLLIQRDFYCS